MSQNIANKIEDLIMPVIQENNFELVDVQYVKEGKEWYLRIFIDKTDGITLDDCELISRGIGQLLDETDPVKTGYILEVSSPGIERPLKKEKDYLRFLGSKVTIKTFESINGQKIFVGYLKEFTEGVVTVDVDEKDINISLDKIASANLAVEF